MKTLGPTPSARDLVAVEGHGEAARYGESAGGHAGAVLEAARALKAGGALPVLWDDSVSSRMQAQAEGIAGEDLTSARW